MIEIGKYRLNTSFNTKSKGIFTMRHRRGIIISGYLKSYNRYLEYSEDGICLDEVIGSEGNIVSEINKKDNPEYYLWWKIIQIRKELSE